MDEPKIPPGAESAASAPEDVLIDVEEDGSNGFDSNAADATPSIASYFNQIAVEEDPFEPIAVIPSQTEPAEQPNTQLPRLAMPEASAVQPQMDDEDQLSPPVAREDLRSDDLIVIKEQPHAADHLSSAEICRMHNAWIPSEQTRQIITQVAASQSKFFLPPDKITRPSLVMNDPQPDPVAEAVYKLRGGQELYKRQVLNLQKVSHDISGLAELIKAECWRSALDLTGILLTNKGQGDRAPVPTVPIITEETMKIWSCRIALLMQLKLYSIAEAELHAFSHHADAPDLYHQFYNPERTGSLMPFSLRILYCCVPQHLGKHNITFDRLFYVKAMVNKILHNLQNGLCEDGSAIVLSEHSRKASLQLWHQRELEVLHKIAACFVDHKDYRMTVKIYEEILHRDPDHKPFTYSTLGRICLHLGVRKGAVKYFNLSESECTDVDTKKKLHHLHRGFMYVADGDYQSAANSFVSASKYHPGSALAKNNAAICHFYAGQLKPGLLILEELIASDPIKYLQDTLLINACTLYELDACDVSVKKQDLLMVVNQYKGNGFNFNSLKISL